MIVENYPQLKSNENFMRLQDELAGTENRIAVERKRYNDTLQDYNTYMQKFPNNIFAGWAGFKPNDAYFRAAEGSREVPKVNFGTPAPQAAPQPAPRQIEAFRTTMVAVNRWSQPMVACPPVRLWERPCKLTSQLNWVVMMRPWNFPGRRPGVVLVIAT